MDVWWNNLFLHIKIWFNPIETTKKMLFRVPGIDLTKRFWGAELFPSKLCLSQKLRPPTKKTTALFVDWKDPYSEWTVCIPPRRLTVCPWKMVVGGRSFPILLGFGNFSVAFADKLQGGRFTTSYKTVKIASFCLVIMPSGSLNPLSV